MPAINPGKIDMHGLETITAMNANAAGRGWQPSRFNPFAKVNARYGAPMGRHGDPVESYDGESRLYARHCGGDGSYDSGGAYWGHSHVYAVWTRGGEWCCYVEANSKADALRKVQDQ